MKPEFFDIFGIPVFLFVLYVGISLNQNFSIPGWAPIALIIIAILGLIVDSTIILKNYVLK